MKRLLFFTLLLFLSFFSEAQTVRRLNNTPGSNAPYTTFAAALAAAVNGDIILVEGSAFPYDGGYSQFTITKRLTIQGPGYFLDQNVGLQLNTYPANFTSNFGVNMIFGPGSEGSKIMGIQSISNQILLNASNITVSYNNLGNINLTGTAISNINIIGNYISAQTGITFEDGMFTNILISNNIIVRGVTNLRALPINALITNNVIGDQTGYSINIDNSIFQNNILFSSAPPFSSYTNTTIQNNVFVATSQPGANTLNIFGASPASIVIGLSGNTSDTQWQLKSGSPAIGAGVAGVDCGIFGGPTPYRISGIASGQPTITGITAPGSVPINGTLNVKVSAKVN